MNKTDKIVKRLRKIYSCPKCHRTTQYDPCDKCGNPAPASAKVWHAITDKSVTDQRTVAGIENLRTMPDKALNSLYNSAYPVSSNTHFQYEELRREMIRRGFIMSA